MEQNAIQWLGAPCCLRGSFAFYKSFSSRNEPSRQATVWKLGEFYFVRCAPQEPACIAELTLLWEDRVQRHQLASSRLYFLPEDTPEGRRLGEHGEDEVLAVSKKVVVRVEDLVRWACPEPTGWRAEGGDINGGGGQNGCSVSWGVPGTTSVDSGARRQVKVLSYPQYCRFRSLQRRIQDRAGGPDLLNPHLLALGGLRATSHHTRILYCRDTFNHPTLDSNASVWNQLGSPSLSVKGRPRKRRGRDVKGVESQSCGQSVVSWMDKMKESVMGSVEVPWEGGWLPRPEEQHFLDDLYHFMESRGSPISKVPNLGFKKIDLFLLYSTVKKLGGYERVTSQRLWKRVYNELGGSPGSTSAATCTRRHYEKLMLAYEQHLTGGDREKERSMTQVPVSSGGSSETHKGQVTEVAERRVNGAACQEVRAPAKGAEVRRRGRPPNRLHVRGVGKAPASSSPAQPPNRESLQNAPPPRRKDGSLQSVSAAQQLRSPSAQEPCSSSSSHATLCQHTDFHQGDKVKQPAVPASPLPLQAIKTEPGEPLNLCPTGALGGLCFPKGLHPLALFRARLGVGDAEHPGSECASSLQPPVLVVQTGAGPTDQRGGLPHSSTHNLTGVCDCRSKSALPPLRIIPLGIDCSLQVRQLMRSRVGPSELSSFTRKLSEVLAQDLSKACRPSCLQQGSSEQPAPLNLSKQSPAKRLGDDAEGSPSAAKRMTMDWASLSTAQMGLKLNTPVGLFQEIQEEPADLSSPKRARASAQERAGQPAAAPRVAGGLASQPESPPGAQVPVDHIKMEDHAGNPQGQPPDTTGIGVPEADPGMMSWEIPSTLGKQLGSLQAQSQACWSPPDHVCLETHPLTPYH